jgi:hypothetical protein
VCESRRNAAVWGTRRFEPCKTQRERSERLSCSGSNLCRPILTHLLLRPVASLLHWQKLDQKPASLPSVGSRPARSLRSLAVDTERHSPVLAQYAFNPAPGPRITLIVPPFSYWVQQGHLDYSSDSSKSAIE